MEQCSGSGKRIRRVAVFCGASPGHDPGYIRAADLLGNELVKRGISIVYGGDSLLFGRVLGGAIERHGFRIHREISKCAQYSDPLF
jgi:hypothetical protein